MYKAHGTQAHLCRIGLHRWGDMCVFLPFHNASVHQPLEPMQLCATSTSKHRALATVKPAAIHPTVLNAPTENNHTCVRIGDLRNSPPLTRTKVARSLALASSPPRPRPFSKIEVRTAQLTSQLSVPSVSP